MTPLIGFMLAAVGVALANKILSGSIWPPSSSKMSGEFKDNVIEIDSYEILD
jgi:hypothetical protein